MQRPIPSSPPHRAAALAADPDRRHHRRPLDGPHPVHGSLPAARHQGARCRPRALRPGDGAGAAHDGPRRAVLRRPDRQVRRRPDRRHLRARRHRRALPDVRGHLRQRSADQRRAAGHRRQRHRRHLAGRHHRPAGSAREAALGDCLDRHGRRHRRLRVAAGDALPDRGGRLEAEPAVADGDHGAADPAGLADRRQARAPRGSGARPDADGGAARGLPAIQASGC